jgi:glucosamine 6-phosphate synthetase-like amidotransferase/phosphosugar isomerase protein
VVPRGRIKGGVHLSGIVGYLGKKDAVSVIFEGLKTLEYQGYDSVGMSFLNEGNLKVYKKADEIAALEATDDICYVYGRNITYFCHNIPKE